MSNEQTPQQIVQVITQWCLRFCPAGLIDPATGYPAPETLDLLGKFIDDRQGVVTFDTLNEALEATKFELHWFSDAPQKPQAPKPPPKYDPPLQIWDARRIREEREEKQKAEAEKVQKAADKAKADAAKKAEEDTEPAAIYYESGPFAGRINHKATQAARDEWRARTGRF